MKAMRIVKQQIWCCLEENGVAVFDTNLKHQFTITRQQLGDAFAVYDVLDMSNGDVITATTNGLYRNSKRHAFDGKGPLDWAHTNRGLKETERFTYATTVLVYYMFSHIDVIMSAHGDGWAWNRLS